MFVANSWYDDVTKHLDISDVANAKQNDLKNIDALIEEKKREIDLSDVANAKQNDLKI